MRGEIPSTECFRIKDKKKWHIKNYKQEEPGQ